MAQAELSGSVEYGFSSVTVYHWGLRLRGGGPGGNCGGGKAQRGGGQRSQGERDGVTFHRVFPPRIGAGAALFIGMLPRPVISGLL